MSDRTPEDRQALIQTERRRARETWDAFQAALAADRERIRKKRGDDE